MSKNLEKLRWGCHLIGGEFYHSLQLKNQPGDLKGIAQIFDYAS